VAFVRKKRTAAGQTVYQVVECQREGKKVRQRVLVSLGHENTIEAAIRRVERWIARPRNLPGWHERLLALRAKLLDVRQRTGLP
jgi:hypothetical protein